MTLQELIAKNEATRKRREAEAAARKAKEEAKEEEKKTETPKRGRKPKGRAYLVNEELPFEKEVEEEKVEKVETENIDF